jgi:hypothetical protein
MLLMKKQVSSLLLSSTCKFTRSQFLHVAILFLYHLAGVGD